MAINNINGLSNMQAQRVSEGSKGDVARSEATAPQEETGAPSSVDSVTLTDTASRMQKLQNAMVELPVVDAQRVEEIQQAISNGTYEINAGNIADKMLGLESAMGK